MCWCGCRMGCQGRNLLECFSLPDVLRHTCVCRGRRWSVCPARLVDQVHSPSEQWVVGESGLLHASSMDLSLVEAHDSLYDRRDGIRAAMHRSGLGWAGLDGIEQVQTGPESRTDNQMNRRKFGARLSQRPWVASSELKSFQVAQETLFSRTPLQSRALASGSKPVTCSLSQPALPTMPAQPALPFPSTDSIRTTLVEGWGAQCR